MYNLMINALMLLTICITFILIAVVTILGVAVVVAIISKIVDIWKGGK